MKSRPVKARQSIADDGVDSITLRFADEKRVSIAWVIRDAIAEYLSKKSEV